jgi:hypothetical protein
VVFARDSVRLSQGNTCHVGVQVLSIAAASSPAANNGASLPARALLRLKCDKTTQMTHAIDTSSSNPSWDEFYVFNVRDPSSADLRIKLFSEGKCWHPISLAEVGAARLAGEWSEQPCSPELGLPAAISDSAFDCC